MQQQLQSQQQRQQQQRLASNNSKQSQTMEPAPEKSLHDSTFPSKPKENSETSKSKTNKDRCGIWRYLVATTHLAGIIALPRPPFSLHAVLDTAGIGLCTSHLVLHSHGKTSDSECDLVTALAAFLVPSHVAWTDMITRQARQVHCSGLAFGFGVAGPIVSNVSEGDNTILTTKFRN